MLETTLAAVSVDSVRQACGDSPGWVCRSVLNWTGQRTLAELADFIIGRPLTILAIVIGALIVNRLARRGMKSALQTLRSGAVQERLGSVRASTPADQGGLRPRGHRDPAPAADGLAPRRARRAAVGRCRTSTPAG